MCSVRDVGVVRVDVAAGHGAGGCRDLHPGVTAPLLRQTETTPLRRPAQPRSTRQPTPYNTNTNTHLYMSWLAVGLGTAALLSSPGSQLHRYSDPCWTLPLYITLHRWKSPVYFVFVFVSACLQENTVMQAEHRQAMRSIQKYFCCFWNEINWTRQFWFCFIHEKITKQTKKYAIYNVCKYLIFY